MTYANDFKRNLGTYFWIGVLPLLMWSGLVLFFQKIHIISGLAFVITMISIFAVHMNMFKVTSRYYPMIWLRLAYTAYIVMLCVSGISSLSWYKSTQDLLVVAMAVTVVNFFATLLLSWLAFELSSKQTKKAS